MNFTTTLRTGYIGMERDSELGLAEHGVRKYDDAIGRFTAPDALWEKYVGWSPYQYSLNNPVMFQDGNGYDAVFIGFSNYKVGYKGYGIPGLGHAGVLLIDNKTGQTEYYSFGRYDGDETGKVKSFEVSDVIMDNNGMPTLESLQNTLQEVSQIDGHGSKIEGAYIENDDFKGMNDFAKSEKLKTDNKNERKYNIIGNNCGVFALEVISKGEGVGVLPLIISKITPVPIGQTKYMRAFYKDVDYTPKEEIVDENK